MQPSLFCTKLRKTFMVLMFTHQNSPRLHYILHEVFFLRLGVPIKITSDWDDFNADNAATKIIYSDVKPIDINITNSVWVYNSGLLFDQGIQPWHIKPEGHCLNVGTFVQKCNSFTLPFQTIEALFLSPQLEQAESSTAHPKNLNSYQSEIHSHIAFDLFAEIFWCLSRYEEVQWEIAHAKTDNTSAVGLFPTDLHQRYPAKQSLLYQLGWIETPVVDKLIWLLGFVISIKPKDVFAIIPTADIDMALRYGGRDIRRTCGGILRDIIRQPRLLKNRVKALFNADPYSIDLNVIPLLKTTKGSKLFILHHKLQTRRNKQIKSSALAKEIIRVFKNQAPNDEEIGMHPSWQDISHQQNALKAWQWERVTFHNNFSFLPRHARLHYIHLRLPTTYQQLIKLGVFNDWSMGYPETIGFRAATSKPYTWFDLSNETATALIIHPFCVMDVTCKNYLNLTRAQSIDQIQLLKQKIQLLEGDFCFVFHNESVSNESPWMGWSEVITSWFANNLSR